MNPYQRYAESNVLSETPEELVVALYQCACDSVMAAERSNRVEDHAGRGHAINRALDVLSELIVSLNESFEISRHLRELYGYMQRRLVESHIEKSSEKLQEVLQLLTTMMSAWKDVALHAKQEGLSQVLEAEVLPAVVPSYAAPAAAAGYGRF